MNEHFRNECKAHHKNFTRCCLITFPVLISFILNLAKRSLQSELNKFIKILSLPYISKQAFSAARKKLLPTVFVKLNETLVKEYYSDNQFKTFLGFRLIVIDGSTLQLPESMSIRKKYGACSNHTKLNLMSMTRISYAYDPFSELTLHSIMSPYTTSERHMAFDHIVDLPSTNTADDLYIFDRGYLSITLMFFLIYHKKHFLMRCSDSSLSEIGTLIKRGKRDIIIEIQPRRLKGKAREDFKKRLPEVSLNSSIKLRLISIKLPTGEQEFLITSLTDKAKFKYEIFKGLYNIRWGGEENYKFHKVRIEIENFSGNTTYAVEQDFHATILASNIRALVAQEAQQELEEEYSTKHLKHEYKINKNISIGIIKDEIVEILSNPRRNLQEYCSRLKCEMKKSTIPIRLGRSFERIRKTNRKYPMNLRRAL